MQRMPLCSLLNSLCEVLTSHEVIEHNDNRLRARSKSPIFWRMMNSVEIAQWLCLHTVYDIMNTNLEQ